MTCELCGDTGTVTITLHSGDTLDAPCSKCAKKEVAEIPDDLPIIPKPPSGAVKLAFVTAIQYRTTTSAIRAYNGALAALRETSILRRSLQLETLETERVIRLLRDAEKIHEMDAAKRAADRARAIDEQENAEFTLAFNRQMRRQQMAEMMGQQKAVSTDPEDQEFIDALKSTMKPTDYRKMAEELIKEKGLTGEDAEEVRSKAEQIISDMFSGADQ